MTIQLIFFCKAKEIFIKQKTCLICSNRFINILTLFNTFLNRLIAIVKMMMMILNKFHLFFSEYKYSNFILIIPNEVRKIFVKLKYLSKFEFLFNFFGLEFKMRVFLVDYLVEKIELR
jgi:hypothetical protein